MKRLLVLLMVLGVSVSCGVKKPRVPTGLPGARTNTKFSIVVNVADNANQNSPIPADFVIIQDKKLALEVAKLSAKDWFDRRAQILRDFPTKAQVVSWEWVPGQHAGPIDIDVAPRTTGGYLFANYLNGGVHRGYVDVRSPVVVTLGAEEFSIQQLK